MRRGSVWVWFGFASSHSQHSQSTTNLVNDCRKFYLIRGNLNISSQIKFLSTSTEEQASSSYPAGIAFHSASLPKC